MKEKAQKLIYHGNIALREKSFHKYLFVGVSTVMVDYILLFGLRKTTSIGLVYAVSISYWISVLYNFLMNRYWSFQANVGMVAKQMVLYGALLTFNYIITIFIVSGLKSMGLNEYIAKLIALCVTISWTYIFYKKYIFRTL